MAYTIKLDMIQTLALAAVVLFMGYGVRRRVGVLDRFNIPAPVIGGFLFAALQTIGAVAIPFGSSYKDVFAFAVVIALMAWKPTGLIAEREVQRV